MDRRDFVQHVATLALGATGAVALDIDRLTALLPPADPTGARHVGASDVAVIEQATATFSAQDFATGADAARQLWMIALDIARDTDHPLSTDQTVFVLYDLAIQAVELGRPDEALRLVHLGHTAAVSTHPVTEATMSCLTNIQARAHAAKSDTVACDRALGQAVEHFSGIDPAQESWADFLDDYARPRALDLTSLAGSHAIAGDTDTAVTALHSPRAYQGLRILNTALEPPAHQRRRRRAARPPERYRRMSRSD
ncbi:MAG: hypothetical protein ACRDRP_21305 [Pseudonocardiaceae bacterium]